MIFLTRSGDDGTQKLVEQLRTHARRAPLAFSFGIVRRPRPRWIPRASANAVLTSAVRAHTLARVTHGRAQAYDAFTNIRCFRRRRWPSQADSVRSCCYRLRGREGTTEDK